MLCVDGRAAAAGHTGWQDDGAVKRWLASRAPYGDWARDGLLSFLPGYAIDMPPSADELVPEQAAFGLNREEIAMVLKPMATDAKEPTFSMGDDTPLAAVSGRARPVFHYLKQRFAQVSNPPIDHLRERLVMSLRTCLGPRRPLLTEDAGAARLLELPTFFLYPDAVDALLDPTHDPFAAVLLDASFPVSEGPAGLRDGLEALARFSVDAVQGGAGDPGHHRREHRSRPRADPVVAGDRRHPPPARSASGSARASRSSSTPATRATPTRSPASSATAPTRSARASRSTRSRRWPTTVSWVSCTPRRRRPSTRPRSRTACSRSSRRWGSRPSTVTAARRSTRRIGLGHEVVDLCLRGTTSTVGGVGFDALGRDVLDRHAAGFAEDEPSLDEPGFIRFRKRGGEYHANNPQVIGALHASIGLKVDNPDANGDTDDERRRGRRRRERRA